MLQSSGGCNINSGWEDLLKFACPQGSAAAAESHRVLDEWLLGFRLTPSSGEGERSPVSGKLVGHHHLENRCHSFPKKHMCES